MSSSPASHRVRVPSGGTMAGVGQTPEDEAPSEVAEVPSRPDHGIVAGRYKILGRIAEGGMGVVYKAEHTLSRKKLAIKILHPHLCHGRQAVERFKREVSAAAEIDHHGIVQVFDAGVDTDGSFYMAMELLEGESFANATRTKWPGTRTAVKLIIEMCEPLKRAHEKGFVHRDLKPDNVFIARDHAGNESVKLLDFGLVREVSRRGPTQSGITFGTPEYMAPEQAMSAKKAGVPADVWSVGVMLYELLAGRHPFTGETANAVMANAIKDAHPPLSEVAPHVPAELARVVEQCLEKDPSRRPKDAGQLGAMLRAVLDRGELDDRGPDNPQLRPRDSDDAGPAVGDDAVGDDGLPMPGPALPLPLGGATSNVRPALGGARRMWPWALVGAGVLAVLAVIAAIVLDADDAPMVATELPGAATAEPTTPELPPEPTPEIIEAAVPTEPAVTGEGIGATAIDDPSAAPSEPGAVEPASEPAEPRPRHRRAPAAESGPSAVDAARACLARGDTRCAVDALQGSRRAPELALLVDVYQMQGRSSDARRVMQRYLQSFPRGPKGDDFRRALGLAGQ